MSPFLSSDASAWLDGVLKVDPILQGYAPGGFWDSHPGQEETGPFVRWWVQSPGKDAMRQDGQYGRVSSSPTFIVTMLDKQGSGFSDKIDGTLGGGKLKLGQLRIHALLHGRHETISLPDGRSMTFDAHAIWPYEMVEADSGDNWVHVGFGFQVYAQ